MAAPIGNDNQSKTKPWADAIRRALARKGEGDYGRGLASLADAIIAKAEDGDLAALKEIGDRLDGRPAQVIAGDPDAPIEHSIRVLFGRD